MTESEKLQENFTNSLASLCSKEMHSKDPDRISNMIERLSISLGMTISLSCGGDKEAIDTLIYGCEKYIQDSAIDYIPIAQLKNQLDGKNYGKHR